MATPPDYGPLSPLAGVWVGARGVDVAPGPDRSPVRTPYRERLAFEAVGAADNHEQHLAVLRYHHVVWPEGEPDPFHDEVGYLAWDATAGTVLRSFTIPRGMAVLAAGPARPGARSFAVTARAGDPVFGIVENPFLRRNFHTLRFEARYELRGHDELHYAQDTVLRIFGHDVPFHHRDEGTLRRVNPRSG